MAELKMIQAVFFDIDNTMYNFDKAHEAAMEELMQYGENEFSLDADSMELLLSKAKETVAERVGADSPAIHNRLIRFQCFLELLHDPDYAKAMEMSHIYWGAVLRNMQPEPGLINLLEALRAANIPLGIGTDQNSDIQYRKLKALGTLKYFSLIVTSEETGKEKPAPEFFRLCVEKAHCKPEECIFIGDSIRKDVEGASKNGLHGVWYHPMRQESGKERYPIIHSYQECVKEGCIQLGSQTIITGERPAADRKDR